MLPLNRLVQEAIARYAPWYPRLQPFEVHHLPMLWVVVTHRIQDPQELLLALRRKVRTHREATVIEWLRGGQDGVLVRVDGAVLRPGLPVQIHQGTGVGLPSREA